MKGVEGTLMVVNMQVNGDKAGSAVAVSSHTPLANST